jgi:sirohydrochlorin ferrochelatase
VKKALLIVDRGSREPEVFDELERICRLVKNKSDYYYSSFCFLEVLPPYIPEGIRRCVESGAQFITIMPYFLYPGMKLKDAVKKSAELMHRGQLPVAITKPLSYHPLLEHLIHVRIQQSKREHGIKIPDSECDILLIGHGSSDKSARAAFVYAAQAVRHRYHALFHCSLELDSPTIGEAIARAVESDPKVLLMVPYFLHKGAHVKRDVIKEIETALTNTGFSNAFMTNHLGPDETIVDIIIDRAKEVESKRIVR